MHAAIDTTLSMAPQRSATVLLFPTLPPDLPHSLPFAGGTTPGDIALKLQCAATAITAIQSSGRRRVAAGTQLSGNLPPGTNPDYAARHWCDQQITPLLERFWLDPTWAYQLYDLILALDTLGEHLPQWRAVSSQARALAELHERVGAFLLDAAVSVADAFAACASPVELMVREPEGSSLANRPARRQRQHHFRNGHAASQRHSHHGATTTQRGPAPCVGPQMAAHPRPVFSARHPILVVRPRLTRRRFRAHA